MTAPRDPIHLKPACPLAPRVLLPADPHLALGLGQALTEGPRMFNHHHGLWGYTGTAPDGAPLSVQATGLGGASAAVVAWELADLGARVLVRVGECRALGPEARRGALLCAPRAVAADGASVALGADGHVEGDGGLSERLAAAAGAAGDVVSCDLFYDPRPPVESEGAVVRDLESAAVLQVAALRGLRAGCVLAVVEGADGARLAREGASALGIEAGRAAWTALDGLM
jgi:uridine phosphorylase